MYKVDFFEMVAEMDPKFIFSVLAGEKDSLTKLGLMPEIFFTKKKANRA